MTKLLTRPTIESPAYSDPTPSPTPITPRKTTAARSKFSAAMPEPPQPPAVRQIRDRAYYIYLERGTPGDATHDWLQAERELWTEYRRALDAYMLTAGRHPQQVPAS